MKSALWIFLCMVCLAAQPFAVMKDPIVRDITLASSISDPAEVSLSYRSPFFMYSLLYQSCGVSACHTFDPAHGDCFSGKLEYAVSPLRQFRFRGAVGIITYPEPSRTYLVPVDVGVSAGFTLPPIWGEQHLGVNLINGTNVPDAGIFTEFSTRSITADWSGIFANGKVQFDGFLGIYPDERSVKYGIGGTFNPWILILGGAYTDRYGSVIIGLTPRIEKELDVIFSWKRFRDGDQRSTLSVHKEFGKSREERYARRMGPHYCFPPARLFGLAKQMFQDGMTWDAACLAGNVLLERDEFPPFADSLSVKILLVQSLDALHFKREALDLISALASEKELMPSDEMILKSIRINNETKAVFCDSIEIERIIHNELTSDLIKEKFSLRQGELFLRAGNPGKAELLFTLIQYNDSLLCLAERGIKTAQVLQNSSERYMIRDNSLIARYDSTRKVHEEIGIRMAELLKQSQGSAVLQELDSLKMICDRNLAVFKLYESAWEDEKDRIISLQPTPQ